MGVSSFTATMLFLLLLVLFRDGLFCGVGRLLDHEMDRVSEFRDMLSSDWRFRGLMSTAWA
jgi:hypothetical protein